MPIGVLCNTLAIALGGVLGALIKDKMSGELKEKMNLVFGVCALTIGIFSIIVMENLTAVIISVILGTLLGSWIRLGKGIEKAGAAMQKLIAKLFPKTATPNTQSSRGSQKTAEAVKASTTRESAPAAKDTGANSLLITAIVLFCASGTGIYGSIISGMSGDHTILIAKSVLDLFTALIFACTLGLVTSLIAVPQCLIFLLLFFLARLLFPLTTPTMINDFKACGGVILLATGFRIMKVKDFPIADMIPAMILIWPISWLWTNYLLPLIQ